MPIINTNNQKPDWANEAKNNLLEITNSTFDRMVKSYRHGVDIFWRNPRATPQEIADALGTNAAEIFQLHYDLGELIYKYDMSAIADKMTQIGRATINEDGTVTITE